MKNSRKVCFTIDNGISSLGGKTASMQSQVNNRNISASQLMERECLDHEVSNARLDRE